MKEKLTAKDIRKVARKLEKLIKGDINLDAIGTIRKGINFLSKYNLDPLSEDKKIFNPHRYYK